VQINLGLAEFKQGQFQAAIAPFSAVLAADSGNSQARTLLGLSYYGAKQLPMQLNILSCLQGPAGQCGTSSCPRAELFVARQYTCALEEFRQMVQKDPGSPTVHVLLGQALDGLERTPEAITEFQTAIQAAPKDPAFISD